MELFRDHTVTRIVSATVGRGCPLLPAEPPAHQLAKSRIGLSSPPESGMSSEGAGMSSDGADMAAPLGTCSPAGPASWVAHPLQLLGVSPCRCRLRSTALSSIVGVQRGRGARPGMPLSQCSDMLAAHATVAANIPGKTSSSSSACCPAALPRVSGLLRRRVLAARPMAF